jgi:hypothetical protein
MIRFYYHPTPNPAKIALFLGEPGCSGGCRTRRLIVLHGERKPGRRSPHPKREQHEDGV